MNPKIHTKIKRSSITKTILENKKLYNDTNHFKDILKTYYEATAIRTTRYWYKGCHTDYINLCNRTKNPDMNLFLYLQFIFDKDSKAIV